MAAESVLGIDRNGAVFGEFLNRVGHCGQRGIGWETGLEPPQIAEHVGENVGLLAELAKKIPRATLGNVADKLQKAAQGRVQRLPCLIDGRL